MEILDKQPSTKAAAERFTGDAWFDVIVPMDGRAIGKQNGLTETEIIEAITHLAVYAGWPKAMSAIMAAKRTFS